MRIAIAAESFLPRANGVSNSVVQVSRHLRKRGIAGLIIAPDSYPHDEFEGTPVHRVRSVEIPGVHDVDIVLSSAQAMREVIEDFGATSVHLASPFVLGWQALSGAQLAGVPVVSAFQTHISGFAHHYGFSPVAFLADSVVRRIHRNSQLNLAPSRDSVDYLRGLGISRISTWGRGVDLGQFDPEQRSLALRDSWNVGDRKVVGFVGRLAPEKNAHLLAAHDVSACSNQSWAADLERTAHSVAAVAPDAPYAELEAALAGMCPAQRLRVLQITGCLVDRARRVEKTMLEVGCDGVIRQAFDRLDQLSHVLFMDTANFALEHVFEMASRGADLKANQRDAETTQEAKAMADRQASEGGLSSERSRTNVALTHVPYIESEIEPFNRCSHRFCAYHDEPAPNALKTDFPCLFCVCRWGGVRQIHGARSAL
jgi:hypothetical protein